VDRLRRADGTECDPAGFRAWLFDLDGVLTRTADAHAAAWKATFDPFLDQEGRVPAFDLVADYLAYVDGRPRADGVRAFLAARGIELPEGGPEDPSGSRTVAGLAASKNARFREVLARDGVATFDATVAVVRGLRARGVATAVVSASANTRTVLAAAGIADLFDACVDGVVVDELHLAGKPAPDSYLEAARLVGVTPDEAVMVEDALVGVEAGRAGGFGLVVGIDHGGQAADLVAHGADVVVGDLGELFGPLPG
jgi:beta-phosphoglucomutase family hydrolase